MSAGVHIVHVLSSFDLGGQEQVALDLAACLVRTGHRVTAVSLAPPPDGPLAAEFRAAGVGVERVARPRPGVDPGLFLRLHRWFRASGVDLVHTHNRMPLIYAAPAAWAAGIPVVHTKHGSNPKGGTRLLAGNLAGRFVDAFVAVSPEIAEFARRRREVARDRLSVIANGIDLSRFHPDPAARARVRAELGIEAGAWVVGTVGRVAREKNQALLVRAVAPLLGREAPLVVAGDGPLLADLSRLAAELGIAPFAHFLGTRRDVPDVLNALDAFVLSSDLEGLPLVLPEAMAVGLPVVATSVGGVPTVVDEGRTGFLVPPGDEAALRRRVATLRAEPEEARACGLRARLEVVRRFSAERMAADYVAVYERVLARRTEGGMGGTAGGWLRRAAGGRLARLLGLGLLFLGTWEVAARLDDWLTAGASPWRPYGIGTLFRPSTVGREGVPYARFGKWHMNGLGFRGDPPVAGRDRVLTFGASETFGQYESPGREYPGLLEEELEARVPGRYDVLNVALPGMRIGRMAYLERVLLETHPRYVVIYPSPANYIGTEAPFCHQRAAPVPSPITMADHVRILGKLDALAKRALPPGVMNALREIDLWWASRRIPVAPRVPEGTIRAFRIDLECAVDTTLAHGGVPVLATHANAFGGEVQERDRPLLTAWRRFYPELAGPGFLDLERRANDVVREVAARRGLPLFDAAAEIPPGPETFADFVHFTDAGSRAMARGLAGAIAGHALP
jgi:glycosyltransferase involved in cell wall biosynthesis